MADTLYERLGGAEGIARLVDDVIDAHLANPLVKSRYEAIEDMETVKQNSRDFFGMGTGGPETYSGKDMVSAHKGMNVSEQEFIAVIDDILGAMTSNGIRDEEKKEVLAILYSMKDEIVRQ